MKKEDLRIVFMGTPEFAVATLRALLDNHYNVVGVVTQPDKAVGRHGSTLQPPPVKQLALEYGLPVLQPQKMKDPAFVEELRALDANVQVVVAFRMLPEVVWAMPRYGTFNVHASLLPQYRGAAPINWAIINGERRTGVTTFFLDHEIDTGRIIMQKPFDIPDDADCEYVYDGLMNLGATLCIDTLEAIVANDGHPATTTQEQQSQQAGFLQLKAAPKIFNDTCQIDWSLPAKRIHDFVRGLSPKPGAWTTLLSPDGKESTLKVFRTTLPETLDATVPLIAPGTIIVRNRQLFVATADGLLRIDSLQAAGKKRMEARDFLNGMKDPAASVFTKAE